jgi:hypothetical protein
MRSKGATSAMRTCHPAWPRHRSTMPVVLYIASAEMAAAVRGPHSVRSRRSNRIPQHAILEWRSLREWYCHGVFDGPIGTGVLRVRTRMSSASISVFPPEGTLDDHRAEYRKTPRLSGLHDADMVLDGQDEVSVEP